MKWSKFAQGLTDMSLTGLLDIINKYNIQIRFNLYYYANFIFMDSKVY